MKRKDNWPSFDHWVYFSCCSCLVGPCAVGMNTFGAAWKADPSKEIVKFFWVIWMMYLSIFPILAIRHSLDSFAAFWARISSSGSPASITRDANCGASLLIRNHNNHKTVPTGGYAGAGSLGSTGSTNVQSHWSVGLSYWRCCFARPCQVLTV